MGLLVPVQRASVGFALLGYPPWWGAGFPGRAWARSCSSPLLGQLLQLGNATVGGCRILALAAASSGRVSLPRVDKLKFAVPPRSCAFGGAGLPIGGPGRLRVMRRAVRSP